VSSGAGLGLALGNLVAGLTVVVCLVLGISSVDSGAVDGVLLAVLVLTPMAAFDLTATIPDAVSRWSRVSAATTRLRELDEVPLQPSSVTVPLPSRSTEPEIELKDATVRWPGASSPTLRDLTFAVSAGERIAVVGPSGSGKSTLAMTMAGFLRPHEGRASYRGVAAGRLDPEEVHRMVGLLEQRPYVFDTTVAENLLLAAPQASPGELQAVLVRVGLEEWVAGLPLGLNTQVGEHGRRLSGGQRQRLGLARLLLSGHPVVVLDEPDEHLDAEAADSLMADLLDAAAERTTIVVGHRLAPLTGVDHTVVLDAGRVIESGSHGQLVARGGWYARTWMREQEVARLVAPAP
jgi:ABC-type transport system involved in cytochrome bd biosynthesis fused ATPase/permease subunit